MFRSRVSHGTLRAYAVRSLFKGHQIFSTVRRNDDVKCRINSTNTPTANSSKPIGTWTFKSCCPSHRSDVICAVTVQETATCTLPLLWSPGVGGSCSLSANFAGPNVACDESLPHQRNTDVLVRCHFPAKFGRSMMPMKHTRLSMFA